MAGWKERHDGQYHYFVNGRSLCKTWMFTGDDFHSLEPDDQECPECLDIFGLSPVKKEDGE